MRELASDTLSETLPLIIGSMLKRVHKQTALSLHKNTTKLTSIDTQVQISEYIGGLNLPSNAVCYAEIRV